MRIAYRTTDEVNGRLAEEMAAARGLTLCLLAPKELLPDEAFDAVLYDWDYWPIGQRPEVLARLFAGRRPRATAVHGYNLEDGQVEALRQQGVAVYRRLRPRVFRFLRRAIRVVHAAQAAGRGPSERQGCSKKRVEKAGK